MVIDILYGVLYFLIPVTVVFFPVVVVAMWISEEYKKHKEFEEEYSEIQKNCKDARRIQEHSKNFK